MNPGELEPFKIVGELVGVVRNEDGEIIGEEVMGRVAIYAANFGEVDTIVAEAVEQARGTQ